MKKEVKEPVRKPWIWIVMGLLVLFNAPWYLPVGSMEPYIFGLPYWAWISIILSISLCGYLSWLCLHEWHVVEDLEEEMKEKEEK
ncbi:hypothetical protein ACE1TI_08485 [Alteribacillus sp. JSM 102045]|uniref:hypothetical protein n=1 Tax=Alteribacillus sp. JSM 102045 TaxID=1562101 RepID=UPI0035C198D9